MNDTNIMIDLETWSTSPNAVITSIGAVKFDIKGDNSGGNILDTFYCRIDPQTCIDIGLTMSVDTILWWLKQSNEARVEFTKPALSIQIALDLFSKWTDDNPKNVDVWGNGADFDNVILANAYRTCNKSLPWQYFNNKCYRTIKSLYQHVPVTPVLTGVKHNALDDATSQAKRLIDILCYMNKLIQPQNECESKPQTIRKESICISLPPKPVLDKIGFISKYESTYDDEAYNKHYNTPCDMRSADDNVKGMKKAKEELNNIIDAAETAAKRLKKNFPLKTVDSEKK